MKATSPSFTNHDEEQIPREDERLINYALRWAPYGGGDEDILPEFGLSPAIYYRRLRSLLQVVDHSRLNVDNLQLLIDLCESKIGNAVDRNTHHLRVGQPVL
ncbi:hypothetical protein MTX37_29075 [Rhodococcus sp. ARC_M8]|uniref:hypothetical protein n=1 Tax=Rhodococcus sp. ARC_M8 TaxID=2928853 RepID=UPI001FB53EC7|nr:hypothetical protein [Rhodococcus sp. ARC_M8]MCJ0949979.1 hypothetical protein [Rhodococcus sp. ARC_M8]